MQRAPGWLSLVMLVLNLGILSHPVRVVAGTTVAGTTVAGTTALTQVPTIPNLPTAPSLPTGSPLPPVPTLPTTPTVTPSIPPKRIEDQLQDFFYWSNLCNLLADSGKYDEAVTACETAIVLRPNDSGIWADYGGVLLKQKKNPESIAALDQALNLNSKNSLAFTYKCMAFADLGRDEEALDNCNRALKEDGNWGRRSPVLAWFHRGRILSRQTQYEQALYSYDQLLLQESQHSLALAYRCEALVYLGRSQQAIESCNQAIAVNRDWGEQTPAIAWIHLGFAYRTVNQWSEAIAAYDQALNITPNDAATWAAQGLALEQVERFHEALTSYNRALQLNPKSSLVLVSKCTILNLLDQYEEAEKACDQAIQGDGNWREMGVALAWNQRAQALTGLGKLEDALAAANRAVGMRPAWGEAWSDRSVVLWYLKRYDEALASVKTAIDLNPKDARAWANQGRIWRTLNQPNQALAAYTEALRLNPKDAGTWANQSVVQWMLGDYEAALASADRALGLNPRLVQAWLNRAVVLVALQDYETAASSYERAIAIDKTNAEAWAGLGLVLAQLADYPNAIQVLQTAVTLNPNHVAAQQALQVLLQAQQQPQKKSP